MESGSIQYTDLRRWRLSSDCGDHHWRYLSEVESKCSPQNDAERYHLGLPLLPATTPTPDARTNADPSNAKTSYDEAARKGWSFFTRLQLSEGHWACDYGGPSFLLPGLIFAMYISQTPIPGEWKVEIARYLANNVNDDGGWGLHIEGQSTAFATGLYYVMLRLTGMDVDAPITRNARACLLSLGGGVGIPQWGKIWLACLNLYKWEGVNCIPTDLWVLPEWLPFHPWRWWVQCRVVYLPTSYLWSNRCSIPLNPLLLEIREEIYTEPYRAINFYQHRNTTAASDSMRKISPFLKLCFAILRIWFELFRPRWFHRLADRKVSLLMRREERNTNYNCLAPVNKAFHTVVAYFEDGPDSARLQAHRDKIGVYLWLGPQGLTSGGTNGVQVWDTAFAVQAAVEAGLADQPDFRESLSRCLGFLDRSQLRTNIDDPHRQRRKGGWPFSTLSNGYIVSDCVAEAMTAVLMLQKECLYETLIDESRLFDCVETLLDMQNPNGGYASYEKIRGSKHLELLNPAEVFDKIMVEIAYPECTSAVLVSLSKFRQHYSTPRNKEIEQAIQKAVHFIKQCQRTDGSWYGSWAICFTYATYCAIQGLEANGEQYDNSISVRKACDFLLMKQMEDGGWGEHYSSCDEKRYIHHAKSQVVNTAWAVLGLMYAGYPDPAPIIRGLELIKSRQQSSGEWLQEGVEGVFNQTCMIGYPNYKFYFSIKALGGYRNQYLPKLKDSHI